MAVIEGRPATDFSDMNRKYIHDVAEEAAAASGGGLPDITESDEGKILTVENGEAAWATGGGGENNIFYIDISNVDATNSTFTVSTSIGDIITAIEAGKHCFLRHNSQYIPVIGCEVDVGYVAFFASIVYVNNGEIGYASFDYEYEDGEVTTAVYNAATKQW